MIKRMAAVLCVYALSGVAAGTRADAEQAAGDRSGAVAPQSGTATQDARLPNGVRIRYVVQGPSDGAAVIMLHGFTDSSFSFSRVMPLMPSHLRVIAPDQRGHGDSDRPRTGYAMDDFSADVVALMDALGIRQATLVGHSMGSFVARRVAARYPERVSRLVLVGAGISPRNAVVSELSTAVGGLNDPVDPGFVREFQFSTVALPVPAAFMERAIAESRKVPARVWKAALEGMLAYTASESEIRCPTLVLGGDKDSVFSKDEQEATARAIKGAAVQIYPGVGHTLHWEDPRTFVDRVLR